MELNPTEFEEYEVRDELLLYKGKLLLDPTSLLVTQVLKKCHSTLMEGHRGIQNTRAKVYTAFTWPGVKQDVKKFIQECVVCQQMKPDNKPLLGCFNH